MQKETKTEGLSSIDNMFNSTAPKDEMLLEFRNSSTSENSQISITAKTKIVVSEEFILK